MPYSGCKDGGLGLIKLVAPILSIQALAQSSDETLVNFLRGEHLELLYEKLWVLRKSPF